MRKKVIKILITFIILLINIVFWENRIFAMESTYQGFEIVGQIDISKLGISYPIISDASTSALATSVCKLYGGGVNEVGNVVIIGNNYQDGRFFSNLKNISVGDVITITGLDDVKETYTVYNIFETSPDDTSYYQRDTGGGKEVTLSTTTDDTTKRLIVEASTLQRAPVSNNVPSPSPSPSPISSPSIRPSAVPSASPSPVAKDIPKSGINNMSTIILILGGILIAIIFYIIFRYYKKMTE